MTSDELLKRLDFTEDDFIDCADVLDKHGFHCEARMIRWADARIRELEAHISKLTDIVNWYDERLGGRSLEG